MCKGCGGTKHGREIYGRMEGTGCTYLEKTTEGSDGADGTSNEEEGRREEDKLDRISLEIKSRCGDNPIVK
jgi:hypothetical protein